jgi:hypothetical protein
MTDQPVETYTYSGTVFWEGSNERAKNALLKAQLQIEPFTHYIESSNEDGDFEFKALVGGKWKIEAFHADGFPKHWLVEELKANSEEQRIDLARLGGTTEQKAGANFFTTLCILLAVLIGAYLLLHLVIPPGPAPDGQRMITLIDLAQNQTNTSTNLKTDTNLAGTVKDLRTVWETLSKTANTTLKTIDINSVQALLDALDKALAAGTKPEISTALAGLRTQIGLIFPSTLFWNTGTLRYIEVLFWSLAGALVNLILTTASYLRWKRFYKEGIVLHISQLITIPILSMVFILLVSLVQLNITVSGSQLQLDLSDPRILVAVSFVIGSRPWSLWGFIQSRATSLLGNGDNSPKSVTP